jgi:ferredoxin
LIRVLPHHHVNVIPIMADLTQKLPENVAGQFYVDATCIDCDLCRETAPQNFRRNDALGRSYVHHQPEDPAQQAACLAAMEECPVEAIGNEGSHASPK